MKLLLVLGFLLLAPAFARAAVGVDTADTAYAEGVDTLTLSYAVSGPNSLALCGATIKPGTILATFDVTFNTVPMVLIDSQNPYAFYQYSIWQLAGATTGDVVLTTDDASKLALGCATFTGVDQADPVGTFATATTLDNITLTVPANGMAWDFGGDHPGDPIACTGALAPGTGQTILFNECVSFSAGNYGTMVSSYRTTSGDFTWDGGAGYWIQHGVPINPATAATSRRRAIVTQ